MTTSGPADPPEPPEPPHSQNDGNDGAADPFGLPPDQDPAGGFEQYDDQELDSGIPEVAASRSRVIAVTVTLAVILFFLLYNIFSSSEPEGPDGPQKLDIVSAPPEPPVQSPPVLALPNIPQPEAPKVIPPPVFNTPAVPSPDPLPVVDLEAQNAAREQLAARQRSGIIISGSGGGLLGGNVQTPTTQGSDGAFGSDPNGQFASSVALSRSQRSVATQLTNLRQTIAQGRLIHATLETAINTDLPSQIRAVVSRDVYGEAGRVALIPKGSRLIGVYNTSLATGQSRVFIVWQRLIRPDGVDVQVGSTGVDSLGAAGIAGFVDTKFQQIFSRAVLASAISIALATGAEAINGDDGQSTVTTSPLTGGNTITQDGSAGAINGAINSIGQVTSGFLTRFVNVQPTVIVDQGTPINVMLNRDLFFPGNVAGAQIIE